MILNWNTHEDTIECVKSVLQSKFGNIDNITLIVDNNSSNDSVGIIKKFIKGKDGVFLLKNNNNLGYAGGNNTGLRYAVNKGSDYVFVLNNDTVIDSGCVNGLVKTALKNEKISMVSPKIYFYKGHEFKKGKYKKNELGKVIWAAGGKMDWKNVFGKNLGIDKVDAGQFNEEKEVEFATGAAFLVKSRDLVNNGYFDEKYFMYFEDADLCQRMLKKGKKIIYQPKAIVWHKVAKSSGIGSELNDYFITRNRLLFGLRYAGFRTKLALLKESFRLLRSGRKWQKIGVKDFFLGYLFKGSWE